MNNMHCGLVEIVLNYHYNYLLYLKKMCVLVMLSQIKVTGRGLELVGGCDGGGG